jgi:hypothetical protein
MTDPLRLLDDGADPFETKLLDAGRRDGPRPRNRQRVLTGLGIGGVASLAAASSANASWLQSVAHSAVARWGLGGAVSALAVWSGVTLTQQSRTIDQHPSAPKALAVARSTAQVAAAPVPSVLEPAPASPVSETQAPRRAVKRRSASAAAPETSPLSEELKLLEAARRAHATGDERRALRVLDEYSRKFSKPRLAAEATVLRLEALTAMGARSDAQALGRAFVSKHANSPHERRVRALLDEPTESDASKP